MRAFPHLRSSTRRRLEAICRHAASPDAQTKRKAAQEACEELVKVSPLPRGTSRDRALATCENAGAAQGGAGR
jgi:hypothetical protein